MLEKDFDQFFRDRLEHQPSVIPDDMWQRIKAEEQKDRKIFFGWKGYLLIAAALLALCLLGITLQTPPAPTQTVTPGSAGPTHPQVAGSLNPELPELPGTPNPKSAKAPNPAPINPAYAESIGSPHPEAAGSHAPESPEPSHPKPVSPRNSLSATGPVNSTDPVNPTDPARPSGSVNPIGSTSPDHAVTNAQLSEENSPHPKSDRPLQPLIPLSSHKPSTAIPCPTDPNKKHVKGGGWYLEGLASPDYAFITRQIPDFGQADRLLPTYTAGIRLVKVFPSGLSALIGLQYSRLTMRSHYDSLPPLFVHLKSIDLPLLVGYETSDPRTRIGIHGGVILNLHSFWTFGHNYPDPYVRSNTGISTYLGLDFIRQWNDRFSLFAEPYYRHQLSDMLKQPYTLKIDVIGLFIGVRYTLKQYSQ